jgi:hypothetical protein
MMTLLQLAPTEKLLGRNPLGDQGGAFHLMARPVRPEFLSLYNGKIYRKSSENGSSSEIDPNFRSPNVLCSIQQFDVLTGLAVLMESAPFYRSFVHYHNFDSHLFQRINVGFRAIFNCHVQSQVIWHTHQRPHTFQSVL